VAKKPAAPPVDRKRKRSRGRPVSTEPGVGRDGLIAAARKLLEIHTPAKVTASMIARVAGADPALVRYYFGDRASLLLAVVNDIIASRRAGRPARGEAPPAEMLKYRIGSTMSLARRARSMQRLMIDELAEAKSPVIRERVRELNGVAVANAAAILEQTQAEPLIEVDPLFLHIAIVGVCEFFAAAQSIIRPFVPPDTDPQELAERYEAFVCKLFLDGLRPRPSENQA
jgi:AcrR family transcriptional regulator